MKNSKPISVIFYASILFSILVCLFLTSLRLIGIYMKTYEICAFALAIGLLSFLVYLYMVDQFIYSRIKLIYRMIRKGKLTEKSTIKVSMNSHVIKDLTKETEHFIETQSTELSKLKEQEAFRREFLGNLAHELKTPAFSIQGYILTLLEGGLEDENVNRLFLERASKAVDRMTNILDDLDEITKLEVDQIELSISKFDIVALAEEVMESFEMSTEEKNIKLKFNNKYEEIFVLADRGKIAQVFANLIQNAIFYGGENGKIKIRFHAMEDTVLIEIADNGPGIEEKLLPRLFERFYRVEKSRNRNEGGSGLGLAIVKHIIEAHEQQIHVRSTVNVGSTFSFTLNGI